MLNEKQKAIIKMCRSADRCINQSLLKGGNFLVCLMLVNTTAAFTPLEVPAIGGASATKLGGLLLTGFTEFLVLKKAGRHTSIAHIVKPGLVIKQSGVENEKK